MQAKKEIIVNWENQQSIATAARKKARMENKGYRLEKTKMTGFSKSILIFVIGGAI